MSKVLVAKKELRKTNDFCTVYIEPYLNQTDFSAQTIFWTLLREIDKSDSYDVHGSNLIPRRRRSGSMERSQRNSRSQSREQSRTEYNASSV